MTLQECLRLAGEGRLEIEHCEAVRLPGEEDISGRLDAIACQVAQEYLQAERSFGFCHRVMESLFTLMTRTQLLPERAFSIYFAFRTGAASGEHWSTRPLLNHLLASQRLAVH